MAKLPSRLYPPGLVMAVVVVIQNTHQNINIFMIFMYLVYMVFYTGYVYQQALFL